ncbi:chorismate mutase [Acholeplasma sp. OttesenSCG-928-E16]|nr:chorismate mutase [Acholeplasma sp. OttesenSCG-928-E16]
MLSELRKKIDDIDDIIIKSLEERYKIIESIKLVKKENNLSILDNKREEEIFKKIIDKKLDHQKDIINIYQLILKLSKDNQE